MARSFRSKFVFSVGSPFRLRGKVRHDVEAQSGKAISETGADALIASAQEIIALLNPVESTSSAGVTLEAPPFPSFLRKPPGMSDSSGLLLPAIDQRRSIARWTERLWAALLHESKSAQMLRSGSLSWSDRLRHWRSEFKHAVESVAGESGFGLLVAWVARSE